VSVVDTGGSTALDFSKATGGVTVNLGLNAGQTQTIAPLRTTLAITGAISELIGTKYADVLTGGRAGTTILRGMAGNDVLRAGSGNNVLLGGAGDDTLYGSPNSNLLIGGRGADKLYGSSGSDILVGGTTIYDDFDGALLAILAEGPVRSMFHPSGSRLKLGDTVQDDGARNQLFGGGGQNWYLPGSNDSWSS
jgi:Ca2+-binding RTX toxin-like protein